MAGGTLLVTLTCDFGIVESVLRCMAAFIDARSARERRIELSALRAFREIQEATEAARRELRLEQPRDMVLRFGLDAGIARDLDAPGLGVTVAPSPST